MRIEFSGEDIDRANRAARDRQIQAEQRRVVEQRRARGNPEYLHRVGTWGEIALCKYLDKEPRLVMSDPKDIVRQGDVKHNGWIVDVKATTQANAGLTVYVPRKKKPVSAYVLAIVDFREAAVTLAGWALAEDVEKEIYHVHYDNSYRYPRFKLLEMSLLRDREPGMEG